MEAIVERHFLASKLPARSAAAIPEAQQAALISWGKRHLPSTGDQSYETLINAIQKLEAAPNEMEASKYKAFIDKLVKARVIQESNDLARVKEFIGTPAPTGGSGQAAPAGSPAKSPAQAPQSGGAAPAAPAAPQKRKVDAPMSNAKGAADMADQIMRHISTNPAWANVLNPWFEKLSGAIKAGSGQLYTWIPEINRLEQTLKTNPKFKQLYKNIAPLLKQLKIDIQPAREQPQGLWNKGKEMLFGPSQPEAYEDLNLGMDLDPNKMSASKRAQLQDKLSKVKAEVDDMYASGMAESDIRMSILARFGSGIASKIFSDGSK
jgi:hypothetical protein